MKIRAPLVFGIGDDCVPDRPGVAFAPVTITTRRNAGALVERYCFLWRTTQ
jgi:hypothetical protein